MVIISTAGFCVMDYLYVDLDFNSEAFQRYMSKARGDGGLSPGRLSFVESWEKFAGKSLKEIKKEQGWDRKPDKYNVGGPGVVAAINAAQLVVGNDVKVKFYGALANDETAKRILEITRQTPLDISNLKIFDEGTSPFAICLSDPNYDNGHGERCFSVNIGVYATIPASKIISDDFFDGDVLFFGATAISPCIQKDLTSLLKRGKKLGRLTVVATIYDHFSEAAHPGKRWPMGESDESYNYMDLLMMDWDEAMCLSGKDNINEAMKFFQEKGVKAVTVTHGADPLYAWSDGTIFKKMPVQSFPICEKVSEELRAAPANRGDTTGCGDNFSGAILGYIGECLSKGIRVGGLDLTEAITWGVASGGLTCFLVGGTYIEKEPHEKRKRTDYYRHFYKKQLAASKL